MKKCKWAGKKILTRRHSYPEMETIDREIYKTECDNVCELLAIAGFDAVSIYDMKFCMFCGGEIVDVS